MESLKYNVVVLLGRMQCSPEKKRQKWAIIDIIYTSQKKHERQENPRIELIRRLLPPEKSVANVPPGDGCFLSPPPQSGRRRRDFPAPSGGGTTGSLVPALLLHPASLSNFSWRRRRRRPPSKWAQRGFEQRTLGHAKVGDYTHRGKRLLGKKNGVQKRTFYTLGGILL